MKTSPNQNINNIIRILPALVIACVAALAATDVHAQATNDIQWLDNVEQAKKVAAQQNKLVLLHFDADWSRPCKALETYVFRSAAVKKAIAENMVAVKVDADRKLNLVNEYDVARVPFDIIITPGGRVISERRSPADAENYARMISSTFSTSRLLEKEKMGPIAHQRQVVKNSTLKGQNPTDFRVEGPKVEEFGLSKDSSLLQRRQTAFTNSNSVKKTNPFVTKPPRNEPAQIESMNNDVASVQDIERNEFLRRDRDWAAPSMETRRAKPQRIVNDRYFEAIASKQKPTQLANAQNTSRSGQFSLASNTREVELPAALDNSGFDLQLDDNTKTVSHSETSATQAESGFGDFKVQSTVQNTVGSVAEVSPPSPGLIDLTPKTPLLDRHKVSLKGKCPVTLMAEGRWVDGDSKYGIVHRDRTYIFADAEKLATFRSSPDKYSPMLAGYDPVVYHEQGKLVEGSIENGIFMGRMPEQKVVLFQDASTRSKFQASPKDYLETIRQATQSAGQNVMR